MIDQFLQGAECGPASNEEASLIKLTYSIVLNSVTVSDWQWIVIPTWLRIPNEICTMFVLCKKQFLLCLNALDLSKIPWFSFDTFQLRNIVWRYVPLQFGSLGPGKPPVTLSVIQDVQMLAFLEWKVLIGPGIIIIKSHEYLGVVTGWTADGSMPLRVR